MKNNNIPENIDNPLILKNVSNFIEGNSTTTKQDLRVLLLDENNKQVSIPFTDFSQSSGQNTLNTVNVAVNGNDSTGEVGNIEKPYLTINAALDALGNNGGIVNIGKGSFNPPDFNKIKGNTIIKGSGKPNYNITVTGSTPSPAYIKTNPTALIGGTIIKGTFRFPLVDSLHIYDLGVDCGSDWVTNFNGGVPTEAFMMSNDVTGNTPQNGKQLRKNIIIKNITTLVNSPSDLVHSFVTENCYEPFIDNIDTCNGFAGFVYKNIGGTAQNIKSNSSGFYGIIIKTNSYAYNHSTFLNGFEIEGGGGLEIHDEGLDGQGIQSVFISNGRIRKTTYGVKQEGNLLKRIYIENVDVSNISGLGWDFTNIQQSAIISCRANTCTGGGFRIKGDTIRISESSSSNNTTYGFNLECLVAGKPVIFTGNDAYTNTTFGFVYTGDLRGGHNLGYGNTSGTSNGALTILDLSTPNFVGAPGGFTPIITVENTGSASQADKNIASFFGNRGSATNIDDNSCIGLGQKNNTIRNYAVVNFVNAAFSACAQIGTRFHSHSSLGSGSLNFLTYNAGTLGLGMVLTQLGNLIIGKAEYTGATNNDNGNKLQLVGDADITGIIKAGAQVRLKGYTVATLPAGVVGDTAYVTDALTPTYLGTVIGGGTVRCQVFFNGTNWIT